MIRQITSASNQLIKELIKLKSVKERKKQNKFIVEGEDLVSFCYENKMVEFIISSKEHEEFDCDQIIVPPFILEKISFNKSVPSIMALSFFKEEDRPLGDRIIYLDGVQDPGNVGTIIRTALAFNYTSVVLSSDSASKYNDKTIMATKGAIFALPIFDNVSLSNLKNQGYTIISSALKDSIDYKGVETGNKFVIVLGNEGQGIKEETFKISDKIVKIDIQNIDSLNVAIAGAILMNEYRKE